MTTARTIRVVIGSMALPAASEKPDSTNTGASGTLTPLYGDQTITTANYTLSDRDIYGRVIVRAAGFTMTNCRVRGTTSSTADALVDVRHASVSGAVIEDCTITPDTPNIYWTGIIGHDFTATRCNIYGSVDGFGVYNTNNQSAQTNVLIVGCYVHDLHCYTPCSYQPDNKTHNDGIQIQGGGGVTITGCTFDASPGPTSVAGVNCTGAIMVTPNVSACPNMTFSDNWLDGRDAAAIINISDKGKGTATTANITGNRFGRGSTGYMMLLDVALTFPGLPTATGYDTTNGNVYDDNDAVVRVYRLDI